MGGEVQVVIDEVEQRGTISPWWGVLAIAFYAVHAGVHLREHHPEDLLWACHVATVLVGLGLIFRSAVLNAVGFVWLVMGNAMWLLDLAGGGAFLPTSLLTHVGGLALSIVGLRAFGFPRHVWWKSVLAFLALQEVCRWITPAAANVNVAFAVWSGWERSFPSYIWYAVMLDIVGLGAALTIERITRRFVVAA